MINGEIFLDWWSLKTYGVVKFNSDIKPLWRHITLFHVFCAVIFVILLAIGYAISVDSPIAPEILERIRHENPNTIHDLEKNKMQVLFMQERGLFFIVFSLLVLSILIWMGLSNNRKHAKPFSYYSNRIKEKLIRTTKERLNFQQRLHKKHEDLTDHDLLVAEMLVDGFSSKEISSELNISAASANTARYRLRKRMGLSPQTNLLDVLRQI